MSNTPNQVLSRLIHREPIMEYFKNVPRIEFELFIPKIYKHLMKCKHPQCQVLKNLPWESIYV